MALSVWLSPKQFPKAVDRLLRNMEVAQRQAMIETAKFGVTAVQRMIRKTSPKPIATGAYMQSWAWIKTKHGAILGSDVKHSFFVERGRRPGKMPPLDAILEWVKVKRIRFDKFGQVAVKRKRTASERAHTKTLNALSKKHDPQKPKRPKGTSGKSKKPRKPSKAALTLLKHQKAFAFMVALKIKHKGTKGRYVLLRTMPILKKRALRNSRKAVRDVLSMAGSMKKP